MVIQPNTAIMMLVAQANTSAHLAMVGAGESLAVQAPTPSRMTHAWQASLPNAAYSP
jgi:hypothetical protein